MLWPGDCAAQPDYRSDVCNVRAKAPICLQFQATPNAAEVDGSKTWLFVDT